jgi:V8-like Glu-specific endopeptidase
MRVTSIILSSVGLAAVCSAAVVKVKATRTDEGSQFIDLEIPEPIVRIMSESYEAGGSSSTKAFEPAALVLGTHEQFVSAGGNATEAPPMRPKTGPGAVVKPASSSRRRDVHGTDERYTEAGTQYPFSAFGRVNMTWEGGRRSSWCSGSLVGPRLVATARHCLKSGGAYTFSPAYYAGERYGAATATHVLHIDADAGAKANGTCGYADDWAILVLDRDLSGTNGYLGVKAVDEPALLDRDVFWNYGYPQDRNSTGQLPFVNHSFRAFRSKTTAATCPGGRAPPLLHMGDSSPGQSGSPVWLEPDAEGRRYQYGVHVASSAANGIMSRGPAWINAVVAARRKFP